MGRTYTQAHRVLDYINDFGSISRAEAMNDLGIANLPAVIEDLRHRHGYNIVTKEIKAKNRYGEPITYARYSFGKDDDDGTFDYKV